MNALSVTEPTAPVKHWTDAFWSYDQEHVAERRAVGQPEWWRGLEHGSRCTRCGKGRVYDYRHSPNARQRRHGITCNRCGRLPQRTRRVAAPPLNRWSGSDLYRAILKATSLPSDPEVQALIRDCDGQLSQRYIAERLGCRRATAEARIKRAFAVDAPFLAWHDGHVGKRPATIRVLKQFVPQPVVNHAEQIVKRRRATMARARNLHLGEITVVEPVPVSVRATPLETARGERPTVYVSERRMPYTPPWVLPKVHRVDSTGYVENVEVHSGMPAHDAPCAFAGNLPGQRNCPTYRQVGAA